MASSDGPNLERVISRMLSKPYCGRVFFTHLSKMSPEDFSNDPSNFQIIKLWFRGKSDYFATFTADEQNNRVVMIRVRFKKAKLCWSYQLKNKTLVNNLKLQLLNDSNYNANIKLDEAADEYCKDKNCKYLHLCKGFLDKSCSGDKCELNHSIFDDKRCMDVLENFNLNVDTIKIETDLVLEIINISQLHVCYYYNRLGSCNREDSCDSLHICPKFVTGNCAKNESTEKCCLSHKLTSTHSLRLYSTFDIWYNPDNILSVLLQILFDPENSTPSKQTKINLPSFKYISNVFGRFIELVSSNPSPQNTSEISAFAAQAASASCDPTVCNKKVLLAEWQFELAECWENFDDDCNHKIEIAYSDPNNEELRIKTPSDLREYLGSEMIISFDKMEATLDDGEQILKISRSEKTFPSVDPVFYLWFYKNADNIWELMPDNDEIEKAFKNHEKRFNNLMLENVEHRVKFEDMTLKNLRNGKTFIVKRRPLLDDL